jgi:hypothetical protein
MIVLLLVGCLFVFYSMNLYDQLVLYYFDVAIIVFVFVVVVGGVVWLSLTS